MNFTSINDEHKVQINLSPASWQIIDNDISLFYNNDTPNLSGPLNLIFQNYFEESPLNISRKITHEENHLRGLLSTANLSKKQEGIICTAFVNDKINTLKTKYKSLPKGIGKKYAFQIVTIVL